MDLLRRKNRGESRRKGAGGGVIRGGGIAIVRGPLCRRGRCRSGGPRPGQRNLAPDKARSGLGRRWMYARNAAGRGAQKKYCPGARRRKIFSRTRPAQFRGVPARSNQATAGPPDGRDPRRGVRDDLPPARGPEGAGAAACGNFLGEGDPRESLGNVVKTQDRELITTWPGSCSEQMQTAPEKPLRQSMRLE